MPRLPDVVCRRCGELKLPKTRCQTCYPPDENIELGKVKLRIARRNSEKKDAARKAAKKIIQAKYKERVDYNRKTRYARAYKRAESVARFEKMTRMMLACFEKDRQGQWQLYEDRMPELRACVELGHMLLEKEQKRRYGNAFPASGLRAGEQSFFD